MNLNGILVVAQNILKEAKQLLGFDKYQLNDFYAQIADATITMIQHILLITRYRIENYESMQGLFSEITEKKYKSFWTGGYRGCLLKY